MDSPLIARAEKARDIATIQYKSGSATLMDFLDAQRTYVFTKQESFQLLLSYWTAVFQLEQAIGRELVQ